jgi:prevent-host-death family protein
MKKKPRKNKTEEIGIRELKSRASEVVRAVKEERARYVVTQRGKPVAAIIPMDAVLPENNTDESWEKLMEIRGKLRKGKKNKKSSIEILSEMRR